MERGAFRGEGFGVIEGGIRVQGAGFRVEDLGFGVWT